MNTNTIALTLDALKKAEAALSDIGDADREPGDDVAWCEARAAEAIPQTRAAIAALEAEPPKPVIPEGWGFSTADFSLQASGASEFGAVMLIRTGADRAGWHSLTDEQRETIPLYAYGTGKTVAEAIAVAAKNCTPLPTPPKD